MPFCFEESQQRPISEYEASQVPEMLKPCSRVHERDVASNLMHVAADLPAAISLAAAGVRGVSGALPTAEAGLGVPGVLPTAEVGAPSSAVTVDLGVRGVPGIDSKGCRCHRGNTRSEV